MTRFQMTGSLDSYSRAGDFAVPCFFFYLWNPSKHWEIEKTSKKSSRKVWKFRTHTPIFALSNNNKQKHTDMTNFINTQREAVMQEVRNINAQFKHTREAREAAEERNDEQSVAFWFNQEKNLCNKAEEVWGLLEVIDAYIEKLEAGE